jgi:hypothetical protein
MRPVLERHSSSGEQRFVVNGIQSTRSRQFTSHKFAPLRVVAETNAECSLLPDHRDRVGCRGSVARSAVMLLEKAKDRVTFVGFV